MTSEERLAQLESVVASLARRPDQGQTVIRRGGSVTNVSSLGVTWLASKETITTSATATGGYVQYRFENVPSDATAVILEVYGGTGALPLQPTTTVTWKAEANSLAINILKQRASSIAGDFAGYAGVVAPVSGGSAFYEVSADWSEVEIYVIGFVSVQQ